jgi:hypothetical protein
MGTQTIYWAAFEQDSTPNLKLKPLVKYLADEQSDHLGENHIACPAIRSNHTNTFYSTFPYDVEVNFKDGLWSNKPEIINERVGVYKNSYAFNWHYYRIFFSPTSQMMEISPSFLHNTSYSQQGHAPSGAFDIGKWFRPSAPAFQLWSGVNEFKALKDEAHLYFNFPSTNRIVFQEFKMTETLYQIAYANTSVKYNLPNLGLSSLYSRFVKAGFSKKIMAEIEANLL